MFNGISIYSKEGIRTVIPMGDEARVGALMVLLIFIATMTLIGWQWHQSTRHLAHLEQHRIAVEVCINGVESDLAKVDCLRSSNAISDQVSATK